MFGSVVLDVAIGLSLLFLFVSLICSAIREAIETVISSRASDLERGVRELLDDPTGQGAATALFAHPLIFSLYDGTYQPDRLRLHRSLLTGAQSLRMPIAARGSLPAYIPSANFARAFLDLTLRGPLGQAPVGAHAVLPVLSIDSLMATARDMPDGRIRRALLSALDAAEGDLLRVQLALEGWFDACMDRVSGWYKRRTQVMLLGIGLFAAGVMNIDAFSIGRALVQDKALRDGAVAQAAELVERADRTAVPAVVADEGFAALQRDLDQIQFPTGWEPPPQRLWTKGADGVARITAQPVLQMLTGWLVTGFAVMLGAPFWFDMLNRFMVVRSTIKPYQKSPPNS